MRHLRAVVSALVIACLAGPAAAAPSGSFADFLKGFEAKAVAAGVAPAVYERATAGLTPDPKIPALVTTQPEFATPIWDYLDKHVSESRVSRGKAAMAANAALFAATGKKYGVDPAILAAVWGMETDYGSVLNSGLIRPIVRSLATLCYEKRGRVAVDEEQFIAALKLVQRGPLDAQHLVGSWAGAIGHLQVDPTTVLRYGTDGDGDGKVDLQHSLADALATSAVYLGKLGYRPGLDWGYEVRLPPGFDYLLADRQNPRPLKFFVDHGVKRVSGKPFSDQSLTAFLYVPAGKDGPKFLMTANYLVLKGYNFSDSYALAVAHLADRLKGADDFATTWPRGTKFPDLEQRQAIQEALNKLGLLKGSSDGRLGPVTQQAYAKFQAKRGEVADGFLTLSAYQELMAATK
ncbi:MAG TPA: lytic murein transglycosylase [Devosiaceae bacterium]|nr:lytic murein transglycosylase [Devosiaceae bacterium]